MAEVFVVEGNYELRVFAFGCARICEKLIYKDSRLVILGNDVIRVVVTPEASADIVSFVNKPSGIDVLLRQPMGLRGPKSEAALLNQSHARSSSYEGVGRSRFSASEFGNYYGQEQPFHGEAGQSCWDLA